VNVIVVTTAVVTLGFPINVCCVAAPIVVTWPIGDQAIPAAANATMLVALIVALLMPI